MKKTDIIILTYKPDKNFFRQIELLEGQNVVPNRIIIINTEEKYLENLLFGTNFGEKYKNIDIYHLSKIEFNHGKSRNLGASKSDADYIVFMTQDAMPVDDKLIENLLQPFEEDPKAAVSYARQLPAKNAGAIEKYNRYFNYPQEDRIQRAEDLPERGIKTYFCSDVCACYRKVIFDELGGFFNRVVFNEDMIYACKAINAGYYIYYKAEAKVVHSHNYTAKQQLKRNFDLGASQADHPEVFEGVSSESEGKKLISGSIGYMIRNGKAYLIPKFFFHCAARLTGYVLGKNYRKLGKGLIWRLTSNKSYWRHYWDMTNIPDDVHAGYGKNAEGL